MNKKEYQLNVSDFEKLAENKDSRAMLILSELYANGWRGAKKNKKQAIEFLKRSAELKNPIALCKLGDLFYRGDSVKKDEELAIQYYRSAAELGNADAMSNLIGLLADPEESKMWLLKAAKLKQPYAVNLLTGYSQDKKQTSMLEFAQKSLEEIAKEHTSSGEEMDFEWENIQASLEQINTLTGLWIHFLQSFLENVTASAEVDGGKIDFPCPDASKIPKVVSKENETIEIMIKSGVLHLQFNLTLWDKGWSLSLSSFEPHPSTDDQKKIVDELQSIGKELGILFK